jgi:hypothetical protein
MSRPATSVVHGAYSGYQKHVRRGEAPCTPCRNANAAYHAQRRLSDPVARPNDRWWNNTRSAALEQLAAEHMARFTEILNQIRSTP